MTAVHPETDFVTVSSFATDSYLSYHWRSCCRCWHSHWRCLTLNCCWSCSSRATSRCPTIATRSTIPRWGEYCCACDFSRLGWMGHRGGQTGVCMNHYRACCCEATQQRSRCRCRWCHRRGLSSAGTDCGPWCAVGLFLPGPRRKYRCCHHRAVSTPWNPNKRRNDKRKEPRKKRLRIWDLKVKICKICF